MKDYIDFPTKPNYGKKELKLVQNRLLEMAVITTSILEKNGFKYIIAYGTLLGAIRHKGFIPWDDDFDLFLFDDEYDEAIKTLRKELPQDIIVHDKLSDPIYWPGWSRLRDTNSECFATLFPDDNAYKYKGINLDLYRIVCVDRNDAELYRKRENIEFICRKKYSGLLNKEKFHTLFDQWCKEYNSLLINKKDNCGEKVFTFCIDDYVYEYNDVFPLKRYEFEGVVFFGPNNYDAVLKAAFGDYLKLPDYEKRLPHYDSIIIKNK